MFYEKEVSSFSELVREARVLDEDSGIRLIGALGGRKCIVFVTRFGSKYTVMTYSTKGTKGTPGKRLETVEVDTVEALAEALGKVMPHHVQAWVY